MQNTYTTILAVMVVAIIFVIGMAIVVKMSPRVPYEEVHKIRYELTSKQGLIGKFEWDEPSCLGVTSHNEEFVPELNIKHDLFQSITTITKLPFTISIRGNFQNDIHAKVYCDDKLIFETEASVFGYQMKITEASLRHSIR